MSGDAGFVDILRELLFVPFNSHYILAAVSPVLFILMVVKSFLLMFVDSEAAPKVTIIMSFFVSFSTPCVYYIIISRVHITYYIIQYIMCMCACVCVCLCTFYMQYIHKADPIALETL